MKGVSGSAAVPDRSVIVSSSVAMPRKPWAVDVAATGAGPPTLTVARCEAGVGSVVIACPSAAEVVAIATGAPTAHTTASAATRATREVLRIRIIQRLVV
jgi:hypothetical protein